jgi:hypothetical protein
MTRRQHVIAEARRILGSFEAAAEALGAAAGSASFEEGAESFESAVQGAPELDAMGPAARGLHIEAAGDIAAGLDAMKKVELGDDDISLQEEQGLEAIVLLAGRPAILIQEGDFIDPPKLWTGLKDKRDEIREVIRRVGRIDVAKNPNFEWLGTGWLAGQGIVITNRHVALEFSRRDAGQNWTFRAPMKASVDLRAELGSDDTLSFDVTSIVGIHEDHDLAVLRVAQTSGSEPLPDPLPLAAQPPPDLEGRQVYVVGYPAWDGRRNDPEPMKRIFADIYNVKRLQPGQISGASLATFEIFHDCSTLGGNSGSPVVSLDDHHVLGLHFGGRFLEGNHAVPLWTLQGDDLIKRAKLNFQ